MPNDKWTDIDFTRNHVHLIAGGTMYDPLGAHVRPNMIAGESGVRIELRTERNAHVVLLMRTSEDVSVLIAALQKAIGPTV